jgi:hypothetical protein
MRLRRLYANESQVSGEVGCVGEEARHVLLRVASEPDAPALADE